MREHPSDRQILSLNMGNDALKGIGNDPARLKQTLWQRRALVLALAKEDSDDGAHGDMYAPSASEKARWKNAILARAAQSQQSKPARQRVPSAWLWSLTGVLTVMALLWVMPYNRQSGEHWQARGGAHSQATGAASLRVLCVQGKADAPTVMDSREGPCAGDAYLKFVVNSAMGERFFHLSQKSRHGDIPIYPQNTQDAAKALVEGSTTLPGSWSIRGLWGAQGQVGTMPPRGKITVVLEIFDARASQESGAEALTRITRDVGFVLDPPDMLEGQR